MQLAINQTESNMISLMLLSQLTIFLCLLVFPQNTKCLFFYMSKFEEEKTIFVSHNLLSLLHGLQEVINKNMFEWTKERVCITLGKYCLTLH